MNRKRSTAWLAVLAAFLLSFAACERDKEGSDSKSDTSTEQASGEEEKADKPEPPSPDERLEALRETEENEAEDSITVENVEAAATKLEKQIESDLSEY